MASTEEVPQMRYKLLATAAGLFLAMLALSWVFHGTGVVKKRMRSPMVM